MPKFYRDPFTAELFIERDSGEIYTLNEVVFYEEESIPIPTPDIETAVSVSGRKPRACAVCGKSGHDRRSCPKQVKVGPTETFVRAAEPQEAKEDIGRKLTYYEFGMVKRYQHEKESTKAVADELEVDIRQVAAAFDCANYDEYKVV